MLQWWNKRKWIIDKQSSSFKSISCSGSTFITSSGDLLSSRNQFFSEKKEYIFMFDSSAILYFLIRFSYWLLFLAQSAIPNDTSLNGPPSNLNPILRGRPTLFMLSFSNLNTEFEKVRNSLWSSILNLPCLLKISIWKNFIWIIEIVL